MERISDREIQRLIETVLPAVKMSFNPNFERCMGLALQELKERREDQQKYEMAINEMADFLDDHFHCENNRDICEGCEHADEESFCQIFGGRSNQARPCVKRIANYHKRRFGLEVNND